MCHEASVFSDPINDRESLIVVVVRHILILEIEVEIGWAIPID